MNLVNSTRACENSHLMNDILKTELGFPGMVFPDVGAQITALGSAIGGEDMGSSQLWSGTLVAAIANGTFSQARLDDMVVRNIIGHYYVNGDNGLQPALSYATDYVDVRANHSAIIRANGAASIALLKNTDNALPLVKPRSMAIFGASSGPAMIGPGIEFNVGGVPNTYQGHLASGSGSGTATFPYLVTPHDALLSRAIQDGTIYRWVMNDTYSSGGRGGASGLQGFGGSSANCESFGCGTNAELGISSYAASMDVCIVFINAYSGEGADRTELRNTDQDALVVEVAASCPNTMVVVNTVGARILDSWIENENVTAVLYAGLLGQNSGLSVSPNTIYPLFHNISSLLSSYHALHHHTNTPHPDHRRPLWRRKPLRKTPPHHRQKRIRLQRPHLPHRHLQLRRGELYRLQVLRRLERDSALRIRLRPLVHHLRVLCPL